MRNSTRLWIKRARERTLYWVTSPWRFLKALCMGVGAVVVTSGALVCVWLLILFSQVPKLDQMEFAELKQRAQRSVSKRLEVKPAHPRAWLELGHVSRDYLYSIVLSEDSRYFDHEGIDVDAMVISFAENLKTKAYASGASTITQQVAKNVFLNQQKTLGRKLQELWIARGLERRFTKNQILEVYFNVAELGPDLFGLDGAAQRYFGKPASAIIAPEGAFIAQLLPSPRRYAYSMVENRNVTPQKRRRIRRILGDMVAQEWISPAQYQHYVHYPFEKKLKRGPASVHW